MKDRRIMRRNHWFFPLMLLMTLFGCEKGRWGQRESVGVAACDAWLARRAPSSQLDAQRSAMKEAAATPEGRAALAGTCERLSSDEPSGK